MNITKWKLTMFLGHDTSDTVGSQSGTLVEGGHYKFVTGATSTTCVWSIQSILSNVVNQSDDFMTFDVIPKKRLKSIELKAAGWRVDTMMVTIPISSSGRWSSS